MREGFVEARSFLENDKLECETMKKVNPNQVKRISKLLSLVLRHQPQSIGIRLDDAGWVNVDQLLNATGRHPAGKGVDRAILDEVVRTNDKQRFEFSSDAVQIRARQGHSVEVELGYCSAEPPEILFHGTPDSALSAIRKAGLKKMARHHVHLHVDVETSREVGARRGRPVLLSVRAREMHRAGHVFYVTENDVWLTDKVPPQFIEFPEKSEE